MQLLPRRSHSHRSLASGSRKREGRLGLEQWRAHVRVSGIEELITFVDGLAEDAEAVVNGCTLIWSNGMVEGFVNQVKWIKRSSYGQAGFPLRSPPRTAAFGCL